MRSLGWLVLASLSMATATCSSSDPAPAAGGGSAGSSGAAPDAALDVTEASTDCDPLPGYDAGLGLDDAATAPKDATVIIVTDSGGDLEGGLPPPVGRWACYVGLGGSEPHNNCTDLGMTCCELKDECYHPDSEPEFCLRPYCR